MKGFNDFGPRSLDLEVLGLRLCRGLLGHGQRQDAVFIGGLDALDVDLGHVETSRVRTVVTLAANVIALVVLFALAVLVLGMDGQNVIVDVDVDVFLAEARQVGFKLIAVRRLGNVGAERIDLLVTPEILLHLFQLTERIVAHTIASAVKRHDFEHFIFLLEFYTR